MNAVGAVLPTRNGGVDGQRARLIGSVAAEQAHRQPIELREMVEVRMGEEYFMNNVDAVAVLELQERRHHAHAHVDQSVADDLAVSPLDQ
jgi:hypothetical protein